MPPTTVSPLYQLSYFSVAKYIYSSLLIYIRTHRTLLDKYPIFSFLVFFFLYFFFPTS